MTDLALQASRLLSYSQTLFRAPRWSRRVIPIGLVLVFMAVLLGVPVRLSMQPASWLTFVAVVITPGYLLSEIIAWRLDLDWLERLALAMPLGVSVVALPGLVTMVGHKTIHDLAIGWALTVGVLIVVWLIHSQWRRSKSPAEPAPWGLDEVIILLLLAAAFVYMFPTLSLYKMDGDAYAVATFTSEALNGRPMNETEPILGTGTAGGGVRMAFNQLLAVFHLWSYLPQVDHIELTATATRSMLALWTMLASYMLGKAAGDGSRRFGLLTASIQTLIYMAAPFLRSDHVSIFFFERINADKFTVTVTMLPVVIALAIRFVRRGGRDVWIAAALSAFAVSSIHALIAAMLALALGAFGGLHLLLNLRQRIAWARVGGLALLTVVVMLLPLVQLVMARTGDALAPTYPSSLEGWSIGERLVPALPYFLMRNLDVYGPLPDPVDVDPALANTPMSPFLVWRFALNMRRQRIILFDLDHYISDPTIFIEPPYLLALLLLPLLLRGIRSHLGAQFAVSTSLAVLFVMFNPILTPIMGALVIPWILWRFVWLLPYALILALVAERLLNLLARAATRLPRLHSSRDALRTVAPLGFIVLSSLLLWPNIKANIAQMHARGSGPFVYGTPQKIFDRLEEETAKTGPVLVLADSNLSITIPAFVGNADVVAHRILSTSELFPADQQDLALQRHIDQTNFLNTPLLTETHIDVLQRNKIYFVVLPGGTSLDAQLRLSPQWFEWLADDQSHSLYAVRQIPHVSESIHGNAALLERQWETAEQHYQAALEQDPSDMLALLGLAHIYRVGGEYEKAVAALEGALAQADAPVLHYRLGQVYADMGKVDPSIAEFERAQRDAPSLATFHLALADACLHAGRYDCTHEQFEAAVNVQDLADEATRLTALANLWLQREHEDLATFFFEEAAAIRPDLRTQLMLASIYQRTEQYDKAEALLERLRKRNRVSADIFSEMARLADARGETERAIDLYHQAIKLQTQLAQDTRGNHVALAQVLLDAGRLDDARSEIKRVLTLQPQSAAAYMLLGNLYQAQNAPYLAMQAYTHALELDPSEAAVYTSLSVEYRRQAVPPDETLALIQTGVEINPDQAVLSLSLADQFRRLGDVEAAIKTYQIALGLLDTDSLAYGVRAQATGRTRALAYSRLAALYEDLGEIDTAMGYYRAALSAAPGQSWTRLTLGDALRRRNQVTDAEATYRGVIERDPTNADAYLRLANSLSSRGEIAAAAEYYHQALDVALAGTDAAEQSRAWLSLGAFYTQSIQPNVSVGSDDEQEAQVDSSDPVTQQALDAYGHALEASESVAGVRALSRLYQDMGESNQALQLYHERIRRGESENWTPTLLAQYYIGLGDLYLSEGQTEQAIEAYRQAIAKDGWGTAARLSLARALSDMGDAEGALAELQTLVDIAPGSVEAQLELAEGFDQQGDLEKALEIYEATAAAHPGNTMANLALARARQARNHWDKAEQSYRQALDAVPGDVQPYIGLADLYALQGRYEEAEGLLRQATQVNRSNVTAYLRLGQLLVSRGRYEDAMAVYHEAFGFGLSDWQLYTGLAGVNQALGQVAQTEENLRVAVAADRSSTAPVLQLAEFYEEQNQPALAEELYLLALDRSPGDANVRQALAEFYQSMALGEEALIQLRRAAEENPTSMVALVRYGNQLRALGRDEEAETVYQQAEEASEPNAAGYRVLALARQAQGQTEEALTLLEQAIALAPDDMTNWIQKGQIQSRLGDTEAAIASLRQATELGPTQGQAWEALGTMLLNAGKGEEAAAAYEQAIAVNPTYLAAYGSLATYYQGIGQDDRAAQVVEAAQAAVPGDYLGQVYVAGLLENRMLWDQARAAWMKAIATAPGILDTYLRLAEHWINRGRYQEALDAYQQAKQVTPGDWQVYAGLASVYQALGQIDQAERSLRIAANLDRTETAPLLQLATLYQGQNEPKLAEELYLLALRRSPDDATVRQALAQYYQSMGLGEEALLQLKLAADENPNSMQILVSYGDQLRLQDRSEEAQTIYQRAEEVGEPSAAGYRALALVRQAQGQPDEALALLDQAIAVVPDDVTSWTQKGQLQMQLEDTEAALISFQRATELGSALGQTWTAWGDALVTIGDTQRGVETLKQAIAVEPTYLPAYGSLIQAYQELGQPIQAAEVVGSLRKVVPGSYEADIIVADYLEEQQLWEQAREMLERAVDKAPGVPDTLIAMGEFHRLQGDNEQAVTWYEQAAALRPGDGAASRALIDLLLSLGHNEKALTTAEKAIATRPGDSEILLRLSRAQRALGRFAEAKSTLFTLTRLSPTDGAPYGELATLYSSQAKHEAAIQAYRQAIAIDPSQASYYLGLSQAWSILGQADEALTALQEGVSQVDQPAQLQAAIANLHLGQGRPDQALATLEEAMAEQGEDSGTALALGAYHQSRAEFDDAEQVYDQVLTLYPDETAGYTALADLLLSRGRIEEALTLYEQTVALAPTNPAGYTALADIHQLKGQTMTATTIYSQTLALAPTSVDAYLSLASIYQNQAQWDRARSLFERGLAAVPTSGRLMMQYATFLSGRGDVDQALALLDQAVQLSPGADTLIARANLYRQLGRAADAENDLRTALELEPGASNALIAMGDLYLSQGDVVSATLAYQQVVTLTPGLAVGYLSLANLALGQGLFDEAWLQYETAHAVEPGLADPLLSIGNARNDQSDWEAAEEAFLQAIELAPLTPEAYEGLATAVWGRSGDLESALSWLQRVEELGVRPAAVYRAIGDLYDDAGQWEQAAVYYQRIMQANPGSPDGYLALSALYLAQGQLEDAEHFALLSLEVTPRNPASYIALGDVYAASLDFAAAEEQYEMAISLDATRTDGYVSLANLHLDQGRYTEAIVAYRRAILAAPDSSLWLALGNVYIETGQYESALSALRQAAALNPNSSQPGLRMSDVYLLQGDLYRSDGDVSAAVAAYERAMALRPGEAGPLIRLSNLFEERGDLDRAVEYARQAVATDPDNDLGYSTLARLLLGQEYSEEASANYLAAIQRNPRLINAYNTWINLHVDRFRRLRDTSRLEAALAEIAAGPDAGTVWANALLGLGYWNIEGPSDRVVAYLEAASRLDPGFTEMYRQLALVYQERLDARRALAYWNLYLGAATTDADISVAQANISWLQQRRILGPVDGASVSGVVEIVGSANWEDFQFYKLEYSSSASPGEWFLLSDVSSTPVENGRLALWDTTGLTSGEYRLRLLVVDNTGNHGPYDQITVYVQGR